MTDPMNTPPDLAVLQAMHTYGGGFVTALAEAALYADADNLRRIKQAWPEYWMQYTALAAMEISKTEPTTEPNTCQT